MTASGTAQQELAVDGGGAANALLLELQATLAGVPVVRPALLETTAFGAFRIALLGSGAASRPADLPQLPGAATHVPPTGAGRPDAAEVERLRRRWQAAIQRARGWTAV
jgi:glycerol kinase